MVQSQLIHQHGTAQNGQKQCHAVVSCQRSLPHTQFIIYLKKYSNINYLKCQEDVKKNIIFMLINQIITVTDCHGLNCDYFHFTKCDFRQYGFSLTK